jgi:hypothetical protein
VSIDFGAGVSQVMKKEDKFWKFMPMKVNMISFKQSL